MVNVSAAKTKWTWKHSPELMDRLTKAQNSPKNSRIDIMTFAGYCDTEAALQKHVEYYEARAAR